jgi:hypothetical protein
MTASTSATREKPVASATRVPNLVAPFGTNGADQDAERRTDEQLVAHQLEIDERGGRPAFDHDEPDDPDDRHRKAEQHTT